MSNKLVVIRSESGKGAVLRILLASLLGVLFSGGHSFGATLAEALNANLTWSTSGNAVWFAPGNVTRNGSATAQSGLLSANQQSVLETTVSGPGALSFWWRVNSETNNDYLNVTVDDVEQFRISGNVNWQSQTVYLGSGTQTVRWAYSKNGSVNFGSDAAWLDDVSFVEGETAAFVAVQPANVTTSAFGNITLAPVTGGTPPVAYQWHFNGAPLPGATNASLVLSNLQTRNAGVYFLALTNAFGGTVSSNANVTVLDVYAFGAGRSNNFTLPHLGQSLVPTNATGIAAVAAGAYHSLALRTNGTVMGWGWNLSGQSTIPAGTTGRAIAAGRAYSLVLRSNGTVLKFGSAASIPAAATNVSAIAAGWYHSMALRSNGTVLAWADYSSYGQGIVPTNLPGIAAIAAGAYHSMVLTTNGTVVVWGLNASGQTNVPAGLNNVVAIAAGASNCFALKSDGILVAWGDNAYGQTNLPPDLTNVCAIAAGAGHQIALKTDGTAVAWGLNHFGQVDLPLGLTNLNGIACGAYHTVALLNRGPVSFVSEPFNQTVFEGSSVGLDPGVSGAAPISYQWQFDSADLAGATNRWLTLTNTQLADTGFYRLIASNSFGAVTSAVARVTVDDTAPFFAPQPKDVNVMTNLSAVITASVGGVAPFQYQWRFNGTNLPGRTNSFLSITNAKLSDEGFYSVAVTNSFGYAISSNAFLNVIDLAEALNATNFAWISSVNPAWFPQANYTHDGVAAAAIDLSFSLRENFLITSVVGPGTLKFWWNSVSSSTAQLQLRVDGYSEGNYVNFFSGWQQQTIYLGEGTHLVEWLFPFPSPLPSLLLLDEVTFEPGPTPPLFVSKPSDKTVGAGADVSLNASVGGTPPRTNWWLFNGSLIPGMTGTLLSLPNVQSENSGTYALIVSNAYGFTNISVVLTVTNTPPSIRTQPVGIEMVRNGNAYFSVLARGSDPLSYQWQFNQTDIANATNSSILLTQLRPEDAGSYSVVVSNAFGTSVSDNAWLKIVPTVIVGWGSVLTSSPNPPVNLTNVSAISAGEDFSVALRTDGTVYAWGWNAFDKLSVPAALSNVVAVSAGGMHGSALLTNGTLVNWGNAFFDSAATIPAGLSNVVQTAAGDRFNVALKSDQTVVVWGNDFLGPLNIPPSLTNDVVAIAAGTYHGIVVQRNGTVGAWGNNSSGQATVPAGLSNAIAVSAGYNYSLALLKDGTIKSWGSTVTTNIPAAATNIVSIEAGDYHALALKKDGTILAWGTESSGQNAVPFWLTNVVAISAGSRHSLALLNDGTPYIVRQPWSLVEWSGADVELNVAAVGQPSLAYQWQFNSTNIFGATNTSLLLTNISVTQAGQYRCVVTNALGTVSSRPAELTVLRTTPVFDPNGTRWNQNGTFQLLLSGASGHGSILLYASTNLVDWEPILTNPPAVGELLWMDSAATNFSRRFYRFEER